jgi:hypothetical protein
MLISSQISVYFTSPVFGCLLKRDAARSRGETLPHASHKSSSPDLLLTSTSPLTPFKFSQLYWACSRWRSLPPSWGTGGGRAAAQAVWRLASPAAAAWSSATRASTADARPAARLAASGGATRAATRRRRRAAPRHAQGWRAGAVPTCRAGRRRRGPPPSSRRVCSSQTLTHPWQAVARPRRRSCSLAAAVPPAGARARRVGAPPPPPSSGPPSRQRSRPPRSRASPSCGLRASSAAQAPRVGPSHRPPGRSARPPPAPAPRALLQKRAGWREPRRCLDGCQRRLRRACGRLARAGCRVPVGRPPPCQTTQSA